MAAIVKYPSAQAHQPDKRFCGQCGRLCQPLINDNEGFGPCVEDAASPVECADLRRAIVNAHSLAKARGRGIHPETAALIARLGLPAELVAEWVAEALRAQAIRNQLARGRYGEGGASFLRQLDEWMRQGDSGERLLALIEEMRLNLDPTEGGTKALSLVEIAAWHSSLALRAAEILDEIGDWEFGDEDGEE